MLYFDHNATTPVAPEVADAMIAALREVYGNPSSTHSQGQAARQRLEAARRTIAEALGASSAEFVFTSGGTESNNLAILGILRALAGKPRHAITTAIEHPSVLECFRQLEREAFEVSYLPPDRHGMIDPGAVANALQPQTALVSVMHANNEVGTVQRVAAIAALVRECRAAGQEIYLHSDGVQALGKVGLDLDVLGVDLYSVSAHKIYAPKGVGGLYVRKGTPLHGIQLGGRHERERRAGTENVPGAIAFARAVELCSADEPIRCSTLRDRFEERILAIEGVERNGPLAGRLPNTSNLLFHGISGEALLIALDMQGMAVSTGSACSSGSIEPSHVLLAMGRTVDEARSSIRFSFGRYNSAEEIDRLAEVVIACAGRLRKAKAREVQLV